MKEIKNINDKLNNDKQPSNIEAEQALLGSILVNNDIIDEISSIISLFTRIDPNKACSASIFEGCFSVVELIAVLISFTLTIIRYFKSL